MKRIILISLLVVFSCLAALAQRLDGESMKRNLYILASDSLEARQAGREGGLKAFRFLENELHSYGLNAIAQKSTIAINPMMAKHYGFDSLVEFRNLYVTFPGSDSVLSKEWIVLLAHYDGIGKKNKPYRAANDNGSSTAALLEIARVMKPQKRSILILFTDGEELGLVGSYNFLKDCPIESSQIKLALNVEMIGRLKNSGKAYYSGLSTLEKSDQIMQTTTVPDGLIVQGTDYNQLFMNSSDCLSFTRQGIPAMVWCTEDMETLHQVTDTAESIDYSGMHLIAEHILSSLEAFANTPELKASDTLTSNKEKRTSED